MSGEKDDISLKIVSVIDASIQSVLILVVVAFFSISFFSKNKAWTNGYSLYGMFYLGVYQLISALVRSGIEWVRKGWGRKKLLIYWMGVLLVFTLMFFSNKTYLRDRTALYITFIISGFLAVYYCSISWKLTLQTNKNER